MREHIQNNASHNSLILQGIIYLVIFHYFYQNNLPLNHKTTLALLCVLLAACQTGNQKTIETIAPANPLIGTWQLLKGTVIENGDTTVTDYTKNVSFIKIINNTHFAFLQHDLNKGQDSAAVFVAGGGRYSLNDHTYTEHLEYCSARDWEGHDFAFTITLHNDTLVQKGIEKVENAGINRINMEQYIRLRK